MRVPRWLATVVAFGGAWWALKNGWWFVPQWPMVAWAVAGLGVWPLGKAVALDLGDRRRRRLRR